MAAKTDSEPRPITVPMAGTAGDSVKNAPINSGMTYGVSGDARNFGTNQPRNIDAAAALEQDDFARLGVRVVTGRDRDSKFSGER
jgi:hypothetical protein